MESVFPSPSVSQTSAPSCIASLHHEDNSACPRWQVSLASDRIASSDSTTNFFLDRFSPSFPSLPMAAATIARAIVCELGQKQQQLLQSKKDLAMPTRGRLPDPPAEGGKIVLQPRLCTLRSYGVRDAGVMRRVERDPSPFFTSLIEYVESTRKSQQFEIVSGRLAMVAFAAAVSVEVVTGNSIFKKLDLQQIAEAGGVCVAVVACAATFARISSSRTRIRQMITLGCNSFVDSLIDNVVEALFCDSELSDWSNDI